jgi:hypothetical protein
VVTSRRLRGRGYSTISPRSVLCILARHRIETYSSMPFWTRQLRLSRPTWKVSWWIMRLNSVSHYWLFRTAHHCGNTTLWFCTMMDRVDMFCEFKSPLLLHGCWRFLVIFASTKLDAEKRLALQEEKQALEAKLLDVYVTFIGVHIITVQFILHIDRRWKPDWQNCGSWLRSVIADAIRIFRVPPVGVIE